MDESGENVVAVYDLGILVLVLTFSLSRTFPNP